MWLPIIHVRDEFTGPFTFLMRDIMSLKTKLYFSPLFYILFCWGRIRKAMGGRCMVYGVYDRGTHKFLKRCRVASTAIITDKDRLKIGDNVWINHYSRIDAAGGVEIEDGCQIGFGACILSHSTHISIRLMGWHFMECEARDRAGYIAKPTVIGKYSFIGGGSYILPGVHIGKGCVVGVNSVVTHDLPDYAIVVGAPARIVGSTLKTDQPYLDNDVVKEMYYEHIER